MTNVFKVSFILYSIFIYSIVGLASEQLYCKYGPASLCQFMGQYYLDVKKDYKKATEIFNYMCEKGSAQSCFSTGVLNDKLGNSSQSNIFFQKSCENNQYCRKSADYFLSLKSYKLSLDYYRLSCKKGDLDSCLGAAKLEIKNKNYKEAEAFFELACKDTSNLNNECYRYGAYLIDQNKFDDAEKILKPICDNWYYLACVEIGNLKLKKGNIEDSIRIFKIGCDAGMKESCLQLGRANVVQKHYLEAKNIFTKLCIADEHLGCFDLSKTLLTLNEFTKAGEFLDIACLDEIEEACVQKIEVNKKINLKKIL